jgi:hypothetical protein
LEVSAWTVTGTTWEKSVVPPVVAALIVTQRWPRITEQPLM